MQGIKSFYWFHIVRFCFDLWRNDVLKDAKKINKLIFIFLAFDFIENFVDKKEKEFCFVLFVVCSVNVP